MERSTVFSEEWMAATTDGLPDLERETRRLTEHLGNLQTVNAGLGAAADRVESAGAALDAAHDTLRATESRIASLNDGMSTALAALNRLEPETLRANIESGFATARAALESLQQRLAVEFDEIADTIGEHGAADSERHQIVVKSVADAA